MSKRPNSKRTTIKDVAAEAQVSISTVSIAMSGKGYVSTATRERIEEAANRLGFVPKPAARQLAAQRTGNVGFVVRTDHFTRSEPFYTHIFLGAEFEADHRNLYVLLATVPDAYAPTLHAPRFLREQNVDGVLIAGQVDPAIVRQIDDLGLPLVLIDFELDGHAAVVIDNQNGARSAVEHLLGLEHSRIAFLGADMDHPALSARLDGYHLAVVSAGLDVNPDLILVDDGKPDRPAGVRLAERFLATAPRPTAAFCANDAIALSLLETLARHDESDSDSIAVVGFDDVDAASQAGISLSTVRVFKEQLGELAMGYLSDLMDASSSRARSFERGQHAIKVPTELVVRDSSAGRRANHR